MLFVLRIPLFINNTYILLSCIYNLGFPLLIIVDDSFCDNTFRFESI